MNNLPALESPSMEALVGQVAEEFIEQVNRGEQPDVEEYARRYPAIAPILRQVLAALQLIRVPATDLAVDDSAGLAGQVTGCLGDFRIFHEIGRGGMGIVYEAEQISLGRRVALKVLPFAAAMDPKQLQRFKNEAQAAAHLQHTNIVPVHYVGCERGVHFYAMQYIEGQTLAAVIRELRQLAGLETASPACSAEAAGALASELALGRWAPIKRRGGDVVGSCGREEATGPYGPTSPQPPEATPPVAALSTERSTKSPAFFRSVAHLGVQAAEALEHAHQLGVIHRDIKPANLLVDAGGRLWITDFGLAHCQSQPGLTMTGDLVGTLRYMSPEQALANRLTVDARADVYSLGVTLYELLTLEPAYNGRNREEVLRQIAFEEPRLPNRLNQAVPTEMETIVLKAMARSPEERYATAQELADDLRRFLEDKPIRAKRPSVWQRAVKWARRHKTVVRAAVVVLLLAVVGLAVSTALIWQAKDELERNLYFSRIGLAHALLTANTANPDRAEELLEGCPPDRRGWEWDYLKRLWRVEPVALHGPGKTEVNSVAFSPGGEHLAAACGDGTVKVWHLKTGQVVTLHGHAGNVVSVVFSPTDGRRLASSSVDKTVRVWDLSTRQEVLRHPGYEAPPRCPAYSVTFSPDGRWLAAAGEEGTVRICDVETGRLLHKLRGHEMRASCVAFSPDGQLLASGSWGGVVRIWDAQIGRCLSTLPGEHTQPVGAVAFSPDGKHLAAGYFDRLIVVWDTTTGERFRTLHGHMDLVLGLAFSQDGRRLASGSQDRTVRLWELATGLEVLHLPGHTDSCQCVTFSHDGRRLASASRDGTIRFWDATPLTGKEGQEVLTFHEHTHEVWSVAISPDGTRIASAGLDPTVLVWDATTGQVTQTFSEIRQVVFSVAFSPDGRRLTAAGNDGGGWVVKVWDSETGQNRRTFRASEEICSVSFSPDGRWLALGIGDGGVKLWDAASGQAIVVGKHDREVTGLTFHPNGRRLVSAGRDGTVKVWDLRRAWLPLALWPEVGCTATLPLSAAVQLHLASWMETNGPRPVLTLPRPDPGFCSVAFSPDGRRLVSVGKDILRLWNAETGQPIDMVRGQFRGWRGGVAFSPDGRWLVAAAADCTVKVWDAATLECKHNFRGHRGPLGGIAVSHNGEFLITGSADKTVKVWDLTRLDKKLK